MLAIVPKFRELLIDHIESAQPDELAGIVERLLEDGEPTARNADAPIPSWGQIARGPFAERVVQLGPGGRPLDRNDEPHVALYDPLLDLTWARADCRDEDLKQDRADQAVSEFRLFNLAGWRLPTVFELQSIVDRTRHSPAVDTSVIDAKSNWYWTSESYAPAPAFRWCVDLYGGHTLGLSSDDTAFARAVRAGQPFELRY